MSALHAVSVVLFLASLGAAGSLAVTAAVLTALERATKRVRVPVCTSAWPRARPAVRLSNTRRRDR